MCPRDCGCELNHTGNSSTNLDLVKQNLVCDAGVESIVPNPISASMLITKADTESLAKGLNPDDGSETCVEDSMPVQSPEVICRFCAATVALSKCGTWLCCGVHGCIACIQIIYRIGSLPTCPWCRFIFGQSKNTDIGSMFANSSHFLEYWKDVQGYWKSASLGKFLYVFFFSFLSTLADLASIAFLSIVPATSKIRAE